MTGIGRAAGSTSRSPASPSSEASPPASPQRRPTELHGLEPLRRSTSSGYVAGEGRDDAQHHAAMMPPRTAMLPPRAAMLPPQQAVRNTWAGDLPAGAEPSARGLRALRGDPEFDKAFNQLVGSTMQGWDSTMREAVQKFFEEEEPDEDDPDSEPL